MPFLNILVGSDQYLSLFVTQQNQSWFMTQHPGATRMARGGIRLVHGHTNSTLITYFSDMKIDRKYAFLHAFFLICLSSPFQFSFVYMTKNTPFFSNFARFCTPKRCMCVQCLVLKNNPNYMNFWTSLIPPLTFERPPAQHFQRATANKEISRSPICT